MALTYFPVPLFLRDGTKGQKTMNQGFLFLSEAVLLDIRTLFQSTRIVSLFIISYFTFFYVPLHPSFHLLGRDSTFCPTFPLQLFQYHTIRLVYYGVIQRGKIDLRGVLRIVPHALTDDRNGNMLTSGDARPRVAAHVHREIHRQTGRRGYLFQFVVDKPLRTAVLRPFILRPSENRQQIFRPAIRIFVDNLLHALLPPDEHPLSRLPAAIGENAVAEVSFPKVSHVDERHAPRVEREEEHIPCQVPVGLLRQVQSPEATDDLQRNGAFHGSVYPRVDVPERVALLGEPLLHGAVVHGTENAVVERNRVPRHAVGLQESLVFLHQLRGDFVHYNVLAVPETPETAQCGRVRLRRPQLVQAAQLADDVVHEAEKRMPDERLPKHSHHIVGREATAAAAQFHDGGAHQLHVALHLPDNLPNGVHPFRINGHDPRLPGVPLLRKYLVLGRNLSHYPAASHQIDDGARTALDRRWAKFDFHSYHIALFV